MAYECKIILDSISENRHRLTTFQVTYPKFVHNELMTHRQFSRNTASSRAIPYAKLRDQVLNDPVMPVWWGKNQSGMQAREELDNWVKEEAVKLWLQARDIAVDVSTQLGQLGTHKQIINRMIEPWMWTTVIITATNYSNFFHLRCHPDAQPEIQKIAYMMRDAYFSNTPAPTITGQWHRPYVLADDKIEICDRFANLTDQEVSDYLNQISVARCARVSYLTQEGKRDILEDINLYVRLETSGHWSPFEHVAKCMSPDITLNSTSGNFTGWFQYRKLFKDEVINNYEYKKNDE